MIEPPPRPARLLADQTLSLSRAFDVYDGEALVPREDGVVQLRADRAYTIRLREPDRLTFVQLGEVSITTPIP